MTTSELKKRLRLEIDYFQAGVINTPEIISDLRALLADLDAEPPKPTGERE